MLCVQTVQTFEAALEALVAAGVELVEFDMGLLTAEGAEIEAELLLAYEMPREVSRSVHLLHRGFKKGPFQVRSGVYCGICFILLFGAWT